MSLESIQHDRLHKISPERVAERSEFAQSNERNPTAQTVPRGLRANPLLARRNPMSDEEVSAQTWLDEQLVTFYHKRNGPWPKLRRLFSKAVGRWLFQSAANQRHRHAADHDRRQSTIGAPPKRHPQLQVREPAMAAIVVIGGNSAHPTVVLEIVQFLGRTG
jgi:hypothetical protein